MSWSPTIGGSQRNLPDFVHVLAQGGIVKSGGKELALELEAEGYADREETEAINKV